MMATTPAWHHARKGDWRAFGKSLGPFLTVITIVLWICLPIFWGSTLLLEYYFYRLNIFVVDFDSQAVGQANALAGPPIVETLRQVNMASHPHLTYQVLPPEHFPGGPEQVMEAVGHNEAWGAVVIMPNATTAWRNAVETGNATYDPTGSVGVYFSGAHFYQVILIYVVPYMKKNLLPGLRTASDMASRTFLQNAITANNATAITTAAMAPQALGVGFGFFPYDVRPITAWSSAAPMEAGLIYNVIFTFHLALLSAIARLQSGLQIKLTTASLLKLRLITPIFCYFWFSLWYVLVVRAYQVPLTASVGRAGFVVFWMLNWLTYIAIGLALEALLSLCTIRWFPFALICWIILNITSSFLPLQLMQPFYRWGYAWPFRLNVVASKIIFYDTEPRHHLGRYFGGIMAWAFAGLVSVTLFQLLDRWRMDRGMRRGMAAKKQKEAQAAEEGKSPHDDPKGNHQEAMATHGAGSNSPDSTRNNEEGESSASGSHEDTVVAQREGQHHNHGQQGQEQSQGQHHPTALGAAGRMDSEASGRSTYYDARTPTGEAL